MQSPLCSKTPGFVKIVEKELNVSKEELLKYFLAVIIFKKYSEY